MLLEATNNFSEDHKIRASSFGSVYRATLDDGREVAIKLAEISMSTPNVAKRKQDIDNDFLNELEALSCLDHTNLVRLLGICNDSNDETHHSISAVGTVGYLDTEFFRSPRLTTKSDAYSFGELLLELLSGYTTLHRDENGQPRSVNFVVPYIAHDKIHKVLDPKVPPPTPFERVAMEHVGSLAVACVSIRDQDRPSMSETVNRLESALDQCVYPDPEECSFKD